MKHTMQPIEIDPDGTVRFKGNKIVQHLVRTKTISLNTINVEAFDIDEVEHFWQLLGYSVSGYGDLSFVSPETVDAADARAAKLIEARKKASK